MLDGATTAERSATRTAALFGALGVAGAAIAGDSLRAGCFDDDGPLRAVLAVLAPLGMAAAGGVIGAFAGRVRGLPYAALSSLVLLVMGSLVGALVVLMCWPSADRVLLGARDGIGFGAAAFVVSAPVLLFTRRVVRVRPGSVAARSRRMLSWCAGGLSMATGSLLAIASSRFFASCARAADTTTVHAVAVIGALISLLGASATAWTSSRGRLLCALPMQRAAGPLAIGPATVDLGIGDGQWTATRDEISYRHSFVQPADVIGDPLATLRSLHDDDVLATLGMASAMAVAILSFPMMPAHASAPPVVSDGSSNAVAAIISGAAPATASAAHRPPTDEEVVSQEFDLAARRCFSSWRNVDPGWGGRLAVSVRVAPSGSVDSVSVPKRRGMTAAEASCIAFVATHAQFAHRAASETLEVVLPFYVP
jgi:hypothetical protein